jgi:hypothetical protein
MDKEKYKIEHLEIPPLGPQSFGKRKFLSLYKNLNDEIINYFTSIARPIKTDTNFEEVLYTAMNLYSFNNDNKTNPVSAFYDFKTMPQVKDQLGTARDVDYNDFKYLTSFLIDELLKEFRNRCQTVTTSKQAELKTLKHFLSELENYFDVGVLTFNYDNVVLSQLNRPTTGFDTNGAFDPAIILNNKKWNFIYHIHGSVHFDMLSNSKGLHNISFNSDLSSRFQQNTSGRSGQTTPESQFILTSNIIAGYGKSYQIQKNPFYLYFTDFAKKIYEADALLFAGYGFSDIYVNNIIAESFDYNRKRPVVVLTYSDDKEDPMQYRYNADQWAWNLINCIATDPGKMASKNCPVAPTISDLKTNREFEISKDIERPLSIWHSGFLDACRNPKLIIDELKK